ncbi:MAG: Methylenetetrahydrofolate dehydrogenase (NADP+) / Methenyltetrahydrofolate cyclohydrolase, methylenetetrahydrofolate dehydrogenase (NADP+) / methenyltetrahydrofolate cyclohydrolase [Candidatus Gottesmanbacteria bacterium GW2011_GWA2_43_14]|uniref:Bifunctional protein FolD n=1 Tax=Candidatus Gottesmanbacteria bacterium GW2011_GWA2_43_14 TaxID=1618443 RepID=A0A0G1DFM0_9BACT|nr:MAG: Methylenetetrahydrofolate dehydrogenase (NADP+) / Methenyltetrahydrofolate cyclohydrolase, methylenetetrahydrofolate dehydrogenase (NADP+) / methenyltetrahydrofolate cyclohydrolase [Candidatus Gottesmanbacteria bacterium GW2011_GWA2_43_14]
MIINGREIAVHLSENLKQRIDTLKQKNIFPRLAVMLVGHDRPSEKYVRQKVKLGEKLGVEVTVAMLDDSANPEELISQINGWNANSSVHGIIIQRPVHLAIESNKLDKLVAPGKDVDGFHPQSLFDPPVVLAVIEILKSVFNNSKKNKNSNFFEWLNYKKILVIGRGETAGKPIAKYLTKNKIQFTVAHSSTENLKSATLSADIIISAVGKPNIVRHEMIPNKTILIGVGLHPENDRLETDYIQEEIADKALFYTPVPGGVGPVNVAMLMTNVVIAAELQTASDLVHENNPE